MLRIDKIIRPCENGVMCSTLNCGKWHYPHIIDLCRYGTECTDKNCRYSHEKPKFCSKSNCLVEDCWNGVTHPCKYGIKCRNMQTCKFDHPTNGNLYGMGKSNLLFEAVGATMHLGLENFNIYVNDTTHLNQTNWMKLFNTVQITK